MILLPKKRKWVTDPFPHLCVNSKKELHGWWPGKRECTAERLLINPYNGCSIDCFCCYAKALPGYFRIFQEQKIVTVFQNFDRVIAAQLDSIAIASCGYLSPVTDPFQPINQHYHLSEKIIEEFVKRNIPIEFITKSKVPPIVIELLRTQKHSFGQFSLLTPKEELRQHLMEGGATTEEIFQEMKRLVRYSIPVVLRVDPIIPYLTDNFSDLKNLIEQAIGTGVSHIVASVMDIPWRIYPSVMKKVASWDSQLAYNLKQLYREKFDGYYHAKIDYRKSLFQKLRNFCDQKGITFALCMEYELINGKPCGLNHEFMSSTNCEGMDIPIYIRRGQYFEPAANCKGACLTCQNALCGIEDLAMGRNSKKAFRLTDYRRWSKEIFNYGMKK